MGINPDPSVDDSSVRDLTIQLGGQLAQLLRDEVALARAELFARARQAVTGGVLVGAAALLGLTGWLAVVAAGNPVHSWVKQALRSRAVTALTWPPGTVVLYAAVVAATHLTPFMNLVLTNDAVHDAEHALYLLVGYLYFLPVIGSEPIRPRVSVFGRYLLLLATMPLDMAVGVTLMLVPHEIFPAYAQVGRDWGPGLVADLHLGGFIMFAGGDLIMTVLGVAMAVSLVRQPPRPGLADGAAALAAYNASLDHLAGPAARRAPSRLSRWPR